MPKKYNTRGAKQRLSIPRDVGGDYEFPGSEYTPEQIEFMMAMHRLRQRKPFPTFADVLQAAKQLGYAKITQQSS